MDASKIKLKILILQIIDYSLAFSVLGVAVYTYYHPDNFEMLLFIAILGLFLLNRVGQFTLGKIHVYKVELEQETRRTEHMTKREEASEYKKKSRSK